MLIDLCSAGKKKNSNITVPKRLSDQLMNVLGTDQKFLTYNDIRKLLTKYKMEKKLKVIFSSHLQNVDINFL